METPSNVFTHNIILQHFQSHLAWILPLQLHWE